MLAACVAALVVVVHATALLHFALVAHGVCAEHGHLVHEGGAETPAAVVKTPGKSAPDGGSTAAVHAEDTSHDHCLSPARGPGEFVLPTTALASIDELGFSAAHATSGAATPLASTDLLLFAPKQSPPL